MPTTRGERGLNGEVATVPPADRQTAELSTDELRNSGIVESGAKQLGFSAATVSTPR